MYCAVIFTSRRALAEDGSLVDERGYEAASARMVALARQQPGYLGYESTHSDDGAGITVSYWRSEEDAHAWGSNPEHRLVQREGVSRWYSWHTLRIGIVDDEWVD